MVSGFATQSLWARAETTFPTTPPHITPAASATSRDGTNESASAAKSSTTDSATHASERWWNAHHGVATVAFTTRSAAARAAAGARISKSRLETAGEIVSGVPRSTKRGIDAIARPVHTQLEDSTHLHGSDPTAARFA